MSPFKPISLLLLLIGAFLLFPPTQKRPDLTLVGYLSERDGLGRQSIEILDLFANDLTMNVVRTRREKGEKAPKPYQKYLDDKHPHWGKVILFEDMLWRPSKEYYKKILSSDRSKSIRIAYSLWESTALPVKWVEILNTHFDAVVVPCSFLVTAYQTSGVTIPIFELPLGLNLEPFLTQPAKTKPHTPFVFGNLSACSERKNQKLLVRAFAKAFGNDSSVLLRLNSRYGEESVKQEILQEIETLGLTNVLFTQEALSADEYLALFQTIDCYVSPSKGEGFSIQPREAMALGIPTIVTDNTGQEDLSASEHAIAISSTTESPAIYPWGETYGNYFDCPLDELATSLHAVREDYKRALASAEHARVWVQRFSRDTLRPHYQTLIQPQSVVLATENAIRGEQIFTSSRKLAHKYQRILHAKKPNNLYKRKHSIEPKDEK